mmetsp:Transcript_3793/g.14582  ORF Transcript_3793/g.14582 Transcript_3793/m.14582 type:complete len:277 (-) Transcript_3793:783-1613(-)
MVRNLAVSKLQAMSGTDDNSAITRRDHLLLTKLFERSERDASVRAVKHTRQIGFRGSIHHFLFRRLLNDTVRFRERINRAIDGNRITDLDRGRESRLSLDGFELIPTLLVGAVQRVGVRCLRNDHARQSVDETKVLAHLEPLEESVDIAEVATRDDDVIRNFPVELLADFNRRRLLTFEAQRVQRVRQVDRKFRGDFANETHASVKIGVNRKHKRAVGDRLDKLCNRDLVCRKEDYGWDTRSGRVRAQRGGSITSGRTADGGKRLTHLTHAVDLGH